MNAQRAVPKLSYLQVSRLKKNNMNRKKLFNFWNLVLLTGSTFHLKDKKKTTVETLPFTYTVFNSWHSGNFNKNENIVGIIKLTKNIIDLIKL